MRLVLLVVALAVGASALAEGKLDNAGSIRDIAPAENPGSGARVRAGGGQGGKAIHWMAFNGDEAGVSQAIISGASVNSRVKKGSTPLHLAAYNGHTAVARLLIEHGARVNARTRDGITPLDWAQSNGHEEMAKLLIAHGAKPTNAAHGRPKDAGPSNGQWGKKTDPSPDLGRGAPFKYSLMQIPADMLVVNPGLKNTDQERQVPEPAGIYRIQLGAFSSRKRAQDAWTLYQKKYPESLGSRNLILDHADVNGKSLYRVHTGPMSRADAWAICAQLEQAGQSCAVMKRGSP